VYFVVELLTRWMTVFLLYVHTCTKFSVHTVYVLAFVCFVYFLDLKKLFVQLSSWTTQLQNDVLRCHVGGSQLSPSQHPSVTSLPVVRIKFRVRFALALS